MQKIFVGAPGTGKSYYIEEDIIKGILKSNEFCYERVTFYPEYDYQDFVGAIIPMLNDNSEVIYKFSPGPLTRILKKAVDNKDSNFYLVIEEMTRGNCSAIFGDIFQLLDRKENGESTYAIDNPTISNYIFGNKNDMQKIVLPKNLSIYGTVNSSDQNVYPMDTAFKRRFNFEYIPVEQNRDKINENLIILNYAWKDLYIEINRYIIENMGLEEDKQVGPFFIKTQQEVDKLLMYLWDDVQKISRTPIFILDIKSKSSLIEIAARGVNIFNEDVIENLNKVAKTEVNGNFVGDESYTENDARNNVWKILGIKKYRTRIFSKWNEFGSSMDMFSALCKMLNNGDTTIEKIINRLLEFNGQKNNPTQEQEYPFFVRWNEEFTDGKYDDDKVKFLSMIKDLNFEEMEKSVLIDTLNSFEGNQIYIMIKRKESWINGFKRTIEKEIV